MSPQPDYDQAAEAWASGPELIYGPLATALVAATPLPLTGRLVLDIGAGTGAGSRALAKVDARVMAIDLSHAMLAHGRTGRRPAAVGDILALPVRDRVADGALAAFVLNHVDRPVEALAELRRVLRPSGVVLATVFSNDDRPPLKDSVDAAAVSFGWQPPDWYTHLREGAATLLGTATAMRAAATAASLVDIDVADGPVDVGTYSPRQMVAYRLGHAHLAPFVATLPAERRRRLVAAAMDAVGTAPIRYAPPVVRLVARTPDRSFSQRRARTSNA